MVKLWKRLERIGVISCLLGTLITIITGQANYAIIPITLTLSVIYINRNQQEQQIKSRAFKREVQKLRKQLHHLYQISSSQQPIAEDYRLIELEKALFLLNQRLVSLEKNPPSEKSVAQLPTQAITHQDLQQYLNEFREEIDRVYWKQIETVINYLQKIETSSQYNYTLITGRTQSHDILINALQEAEEQVIMVCPWLGYGFNQKVFTLCENVLKRGAYLKIGWGKSEDIKNNQLDTKFNANAHYLDQLKAISPERFRDKLIGTHEKFLVCDDKYAFLGSHNFLTSGPQENERELGIKTNDPRLIQELIKRFNEAKPLA